ncbi:putative ribosomal RNA small subunit methyltransferase NEP1 [Apostichopus japonicus]|uniref:Putative ribosomal RNA small subunit methyltransferase NEP1 n=1 Tax=Stichopus japonicus TaxID=307972 RepID=A0A2G8KSK6_STIJA|nr:putative ribosomal RNA small subunit methyltransferase NEP1 [Apostichopus japonicus]
MDPAACRPDIAHQCLLMLFDSPLNRAGLLQVFVHTTRNALIQISPQTRIPRTLDRFSGLMVQLLHKLSIHASDGPQKLMKVIKNPVSSHLPLGCKKYCTSFAAKRCVNPRELAATNKTVVVVVGAMAHGKLDLDYTEEEVAISQYPLSAALTCAKVCSGFEESWGVN